MSLDQYFAGVLSGNKAGSSVGVAEPELQMPLTESTPEEHWRIADISAAAGTRQVVFPAKPPVGFVFRALQASKIGPANKTFPL